MVVLTGPKFSSKTSSIGLANFTVTPPLTNPAFLTFLADRGRIWNRSDFAPDEPIAAPASKTASTDQVPSDIDPIDPAICLTFSVGMTETAHEAFGRCYKKMLAWMNEVAETPGYVNPTVSPVVEERQELDEVTAGIEEGGWNDNWSDDDVQGVSMESKAVDGLLAERMVVIDDVSGKLRVGEKDGDAVEVELAGVKVPEDLAAAAHLI
jgi:hypothetical protein